MPKVVGYHRPESVVDALALLDGGEVPRILLAGGTVVNADRSGDPVEVVDLQATGLSGIVADGDVLSVGATTTLQELADDRAVPRVLADLAKRELPSSLRTLGTIGGLVAAADPDSELLAGMLAFGTTVEIESDGPPMVRDLKEVLHQGANGGIITRVTIPSGGTAAAARTGRTPGDAPIVAAVGHKAGDGVATIAMCGVAATPVVVADVGSLDPPGDFRGTPAYRRHLAAVLAARVRSELG